MMVMSRTPVRAVTSELGSAAVTSPTAPPRSRRALAALATTVAVALTGCGSDDSASPDSDGATTTTVDGASPVASWDDPEAGKAEGAPTITAPDGDRPTELDVTDLVEGSGEALSDGQYAVVDYTGALWENGLVFDSSYARAPFVVKVGAGNVIQGWDQGLVGMKVGGQRQLVIPSDLAYGSQARDPIPADAPLIFIVDLRAILTHPGAIAPIAGGAPTEVKRTVEIEGSGDTAGDGSVVNLLYIVVDGESGTVLADSWEAGGAVGFRVGSDTESNPAWDELLTGLRAGDRVRYELPTQTLLDLGWGQTPEGGSAVLLLDVVSVS